jgi:hypothetical protein
MSQDGAHTTFLYGLHHFSQQSSDNSKTRWHDLQMRNMSIHILCAGFLMEMLELHWGNVTVGIQIRGNPTDVFLLQHMPL